MVRLLLLLLVGAGMLPLLVPTGEADAKTWYVYVEDMPKPWEKHFGDVLDESFSYWERNLPDTSFTLVDHVQQAEFVVQWASQYLDSKLGYYTTSTQNAYGRPYITITLGYMDGESVPWQERKFNLVNSEYAGLITIHELGHAIGFGHSDDPASIMYPTIYDYNTWLSKKESKQAAEDGTGSEPSPAANVPKPREEPRPVPRNVVDPEPSPATNDPIPREESRPDMGDGTLPSDRATVPNPSNPEDVDAAAATAAAAQYAAKSADLQNTVNSGVDEAKRSISMTRDVLHSRNYQSPMAQEELDGAWKLLDEAKNRLAQSEWTQKEGESYLNMSNYEGAYYKYMHSDGMIKKVWGPINEANLTVEHADELERQYLENNKVQDLVVVEKQKKNCFLFWCF